MEEDKPATKGDTEIAEIVANPNAPFDGEWKGKFVAESGETPEHGGPQVCLFRETYFNATVKDNRFLAVIDQKGDKRKFEGAIEKDGKLDIWGEWKLSDVHLSALYGTEGMAIKPMNVSGIFSRSRFKGRFVAQIGQVQSPPRCNGSIYLARAPLTLAEAEAEATAADPELYRKVKALEKLLGQAAKAGGTPSGRQAPDAGPRAAAQRMELELWDSIKGSARVEDFQAYLGKYPEGRFAALTRSIIGQLTALSQEREELQAWESVKDSTKMEVFQAYLATHPEGRFAERARRSIQELAALAREREELQAWQSVKDSTKAEDFQGYLKAYPEGRFAVLAGERLRQLAALARARDEFQAWESIKDSVTTEDFQRYLKTHPDGRFAERARRSIRELATLAQEREELQAWESVKDSTKTEVFQAYLATHPEGRFAERARRSIQELAALAREREESQAWQSVKDSTKAEDFQGYLKTYPYGRFAVLARTRIRQLADLAREGEELTAWESVRNSTRVADLQAYLGTYPTGRFAGAAEQRRKELLRLAAIPDIDFGQYYALVIGNDDHEFLPDLKTAQADARAVAEVLQDRYGFTVELLLNATRRDILQALGTLRRKLTENDNLLVYYAGHGVIDEATERGYWLPVDAEEDSDVNWISNARLTDALKATDAWHALVVADSCYSGTLVRGIPAPVKGGERGKLLERLALKKSRTVLSSGGLEPVMDSGGGGHLVFAKAFLNVLGGNDEVLEAQRVFSALRSKVVANADQTPQYSDIHKAGHDGGDFLFVPSR